MERIKKKLLDSTLRVYVIFALAVLLAGAPAIYYSTKWIYINDTDETLELSKSSFLTHTLPMLKEEDIPSFNRMNWDIRIEPPEKNVQKEVFLFRPFPDSLEQENENYRVLLTPVTIENKPFTLVVRMNMIESENLIKSIAIAFTAIIIFLLAGLYFISRKLSRRLWSPFYHSLIQIEKFEIDKNVLPRWPSTHIEEFNRLNKAVNTLIERNIAIYKSQKEFIENAAHELQTPLAAFQARLDSLLQTPGISAEQARLITDLYDAAKRLNRLNKNLLLLSKLDNGWYSEMQEIRVNEIIENQLAFFSDRSISKNLSFSCEISGDIMLKTNPVIFEILINNLLSNSIRHNIKNGTVKVVAGNSRLSICNSGKPVALESERIFNRFSSSQSGSGLGLSIIKKITDLCQWQVVYRFEDNHHIFDVNY